MQIRGITNVQLMSFKDSIALQATVWAKEEDRLTELEKLALSMQPATRALPVQVCATAEV